MRLLFKGELEIKKSVFWRSIVCMSETNKFLCEHCYCSNVDVGINGSHNLVNCAGYLYKSRIQIEGVDNRVIIEKGAKVYNTVIHLRGNKCSIFIGKGTTIGGSFIVCMGVNNEIHIGKDCMFADCIDIWSTDSHPIYSLDKNELLNPSASIFIGDHVWVGKSVSILKGSTIGDGAVVGMKSIITKDVPPHSICVGSPAKIIRNDVIWDRSYIKK